MKKAITQAVATRAKPAANPYQIHDTLTPGFVMRVQPTGKRIWKLVVKGKPITLGYFPAMTASMARARAHQIILGEGEVQPAKVPTLADFISEYYGDYAAAHHARPEETMRTLAQFNMDGKPLDQIRAADIEKYRTAKLTGGTKRATINRYITTLKSALQKAVEWDLLEANPLARVKPLKLDQSHVVRYLSPDEEERLYRALLHAEPRMRAIVTVALNTGLRRGELMSMTWGDVDFKKGMITVHGHRAKSGQTRYVPINDTAAGALRSWRGAAVPLGRVVVFGTKDLRTYWRQLLKGAGVERFRFHDCRHHFASKLVMAGVPLNTVRELLGHSGMAMTLRYAHLAPSAMVDAVKLIG